MYLFASALVFHLTELNAAGRRDEFGAVFCVLHRMEAEGDSFVRELATIGFLEDLQNTNMHACGSAPEDFLVFLSPLLQWWWEEVRLFWNGEAPYVGGSGRPAPTIRPSSMTKSHTTRGRSRTLHTRPGDGDAECGADGLRRDVDGKLQAAEATEEGIRAADDRVEMRAGNRTDRENDCHQGGAGCSRVLQ